MVSGGDKTIDPLRAWIYSEDGYEFGLDFQRELEARRRAYVTHVANDPAETAAVRQKAKADLEKHERFIRDRDERADAMPAKSHQAR